ncbi:MAG: hypothetical protein ACFFB3_15875, partial [Candidatus Hodarchaeota archaeon]
VLKGLALENLAGIIREAWLVIPVKEDINTDFYLVAYFVFNPDDPGKCTRKEIQDKLESVAIKLYQKIKDKIPVSPVFS